MITVTCLDSQLLSYFPTGFTPGGSWTEGGEAWSVSLGQITFCCKPNGEPPTGVSESVPFGYLHQGRQNVGRLHDRDVFHVSGEGYILVSGRVSSSTPAMSTPQTYNESKATLFSGVNVSIGPIIPWKDGIYNRSHAHIFPAKTSTYFRLPEREVEVGYRVSIQGMYAVAEYTYTRKNYEYEEKVAGVWRTKQWTGGGTYFGCTFYQMFQVSNVASLKKSPLYSKVLSADYYSLPKHPTNQDPGLLLADPLWYGVVCSTSVTKRSSQTADQEAGSSAVFTSIITSLRTADMVGYVNRVFAACPCEIPWEDLTEDLVSQQDYVDANILLTAFDLIRLKAQLSSWRNLSNMFSSAAKGSAKTFRAFKGTMANALFAKNVLRNTKSWSKIFGSTYLGVDYGVLPTVRDTRALYDGMRAFAKFATTPKRKHARRSSAQGSFLDTPVKSTRVLTMEPTYRVPTDFLGKYLTEQMETIEDIRKWGMFPTVEMAWDFLPFSFVADWFCDIGDAAEDADTVIRAQYYPVHHVIMSTASTWSPLVTRIWPYLGVTGVVSFRNYDRYISQALPLPAVQTGEGSGLGSHWAEATALVVTRH